VAFLAAECGRRLAAPPGRSSSLRCGRSTWIFGVAGGSVAAIEDRRLNHAIHMAAVTQIRHRHSQGRAYYDKKLAEGKTPKEALRSLKRQVSNAIFACLQADARRAAARAKGPGGQQGNDSVASAAGSHPRHRLFGQATPGPGHHPTAAASSPAPGPAARRRPHSAARKAKAKGSLITPQRPKGTSHPAKKTDGNP
jgi:hypothetical protein